MEDDAGVARWQPAPTEVQCTSTSTGATWRSRRRSPTCAAHAQVGELCFPDTEIPGWVSTDIDLSSPAASMPDGAGFALCSDGLGYGPTSDHLRTATQHADGDFTLTAILMSIEDVGTAGLELRAIERDPDSARARISVQIRPEFGAVLVSDVRPANGGGLEPGAPAPVEVALPVFLRIQREGGLVTTAWSADGLEFFEHLAFDTAATDLAIGQLSVGAAQGSGQTGEGATAIFARVMLDDFSAPPDPECPEAEVDAEAGQASVSITGSRMAQVEAVTIAGEPAEILARSDARILARASLPDAPIGSGRVTLHSADARTDVGVALAFAGRPFVRGDVNGDGEVNSKDHQWLKKWLRGNRSWVRCEAAAGVDDDGDVDEDDRVRLKAWVTGRGEPPAAPFPAPGFGRRSELACGFGKPPIATGLYDAAGALIPAGTTLREGDHIELRGKRFPKNASDLTVYFGDTEAEILPGTTRKSLTLRIGTVPTAGEKCPRFFEDTDRDRIPGVRFGHLREVRADTNARHLCPTFEPSRGPVGGVTYDARTRQFTINVPREGVDPVMGVELELLIAEPAMTRGGRGSRRVSVSANGVLEPGGRATHEQLVEVLARKLEAALNGGRRPTPPDPAGGGEEEDPCEDDCEWIAIPNGPANQVLLMPCIEGWPPPPPPPPPPPQTSNLAPYVPPIPGGNGWLQPIKPSCDSPNVQSGSRLHAWCVFAKVTELSNIGLPKWESSIPLQALDNPNGPAQLGHPSDRPVGQKRTMYSTDAWSDAWNGGYLTPCAGAARLAYCNNGNKDWMPPFRQTAYVYKGFWVPESKLPENADPDEIYSYQPPTGPRQYLVGLHINIGTGATINYWTWATFWISRNGDIRSKDGENLAQVYNPACTVGNQANMPGDVEGIWANYHMCVNNDPGEPPCGNP
jgi:hypothetical protein